MYCKKLVVSFLSRCLTVISIFVLILMFTNVYVACGGVYEKRCCRFCPLGDLESCQLINGFLRQLKSVVEDVSSNKMLHLFIHQVQH